MKKILIGVIMLVVLFRTVVFAEEDFSIVFLNIEFGDKSVETVKIKEPSYTLAWSANMEVDKYILYYNNKQIELNGNTNNYTIDGIEYGEYFIYLSAYDKDDNLLGESKSMYLAYVNKSINSISIDSPDEGAFICSSNHFFKRVRWNMIFEADEYKVKTYEGEVLINEGSSEYNWGYISFAAITDELRNITVVVEALKEGKVISSDSINVLTSNNKVLGYKAELNLKDNDKIAEPRVYIHLNDNATDLRENLVYHSLIKNSNGEVIREQHYMGDSFHKSFEINNLLPIGTYILNVRVFDIILPDDKSETSYWGSIDTWIKQMIADSKECIDYYNQTVKFEVVSNEIEPNIPSLWAEESINSSFNCGILPIEMNSGFRDNMTREEACDLLINLYQTVSSTIIVSGEQAFTDCDSLNVNYAYKLGIVNGVGNGKFEPQKTVTREQYCIMITNLINKLSYETDAKYISDFADNEDISSWAEDSVYYLYENDIIGGMGDNNFCPRTNITKEQGIAIQMRTFNHIFSLIEDSMYQY